MNNEGNATIIVILIVLVLFIGYLLYNSNDPRIAGLRNTTLSSAINSGYYVPQSRATAYSYSYTPSSPSRSYSYSVPVSSSTSYSYYSTPSYYYQTYPMESAGQNCYLSYLDQYNTVTTCQY